MEQVVDIAPEPGSSSQTGVLLVMTVSTFIVMLGIGVVGPILPLYAKGFGATTTMVGVLVASFGFARLFMNLPAGQLNERFGRKPILMASGVIVFVGAILSGLATSYSLLVLWRFFTGLGSAMYTTTAMTVLADISDRSNRGRMMSIYQGGLLLGASSGPALGGYLGEFVSYQAPFFVYGSMSLLAAVWVLLRLPETNPSVNPATLKSREAGDRRPAKEANRTSGGGPGAFRLVALNLNFWLIAFVSLAVFFTRTGSRTSILPLLAVSRLGLTESQLGLALTLAAGINLVMVYPAGWLLDRYGRKSVIVPSTIVSALALYTFTNCASWPGFLTSAALLGLGTGIAGPAPAAYVADIAPAGGTGIAMGLYRTVSDAGFVAGPVLLGWLADLGGNDYSLSLLVNGGLLLASGFLFGLLARETRAASSPAVGRTVTPPAGGSSA